ncbi:MAG: DUF2294 domain-containing protein [Solirubrobacteraceae bacterium]
MAELPDAAVSGGPDQPEPAQSLLSRISTEMVRAMKQYYGKGPVQAKSYFVDDLLFIVMRDGMTQAEQTMLDSGRQDSVRQFRQEFENEMTQRLSYMVEQLTGRRVINYQSQVLFDPNMSVEIFVFDDQAGPRARRETADAINGLGSDTGIAPSERLERPSPSSPGG